MTNIKKYESELKLITDELALLPVGYLLKRRNSYFQRIDDKEITITNNSKLIKKLCRKELLTKQMAILEKKIKVAKRMLKSLNTDEKSSTEIVKSFSTAYQGFPISNFYHSSISDWLTKPLKQNPYQREFLNYQSKNATPVRSKSEALIANLLEEYEIPYRYEVLLELDGQPIYPDFSIKNPFTSKTIIWEHFGALHQPEYEQKMTNKMKTYLKHGYKPFENLIYTFEFDLLNGEQRLRDLIENVIL